VGTRLARPARTMIVAAHQPSYLPWLGYFDKMAKVDLFVVMDDLPYEADKFQDRNRIKTATGAQWLEVPVAGGERIVDVQIDNTTSWQRDTWATLEAHYRDAPHFARYAGELREVYTRPWATLVELDLHVLELARRWLGINIPIVRASTLDLVGEKTDRLIDLCTKLGARAYISGSGGALDYLDDERMGRAGIGVIWQHFDHPTYPQRYPELGFVPQLAFLDLVFNCGAASFDAMFERSHPLHATI
jgi:hypothetical protein